MDVTFPFPDPESVVFAGDWHGSTFAAMQACEHAARKGASAVIQLGDFGVWGGSHGAKFLDKVNHHAQRTGVPVLFVDGNHENFDVLEPLPIDPATGLRKVRENVLHVPRGSRWEWNGLRFLALGGATSLDRAARRPGVDWWPQEAVTYADVQNAVNGGPADILVSHDCPSGVPIPGIHHRQPSVHWPLDALEIAWDHRDMMASVAAATGITHVFHGHFHVGYSTLARVDQVPHPVRSTGLSHEGGPADWRAIVVDLDMLAVDVALLRSSRQLDV